MTYPHFIVIGAMKCGTSTLATQLGAQEGIFMTTPKEPNYFSDDAIFAKGPQWYAGLFDAAEPGDIRGEASTHYTKRPELPEALLRMNAALSETPPRLVYMIRNPMQRLVSHYIHDWTERYISAPLDQVIDSYTQLVDYGRYGWQIQPYIETYGAEAVLLTSLERLKQDSDGELARIARHIGHDGPVAWSEAEGQQNVSAERIRKFPLYGFVVQSKVGTFLRRALVPASIRRRIRESQQMSDRPVIPDVARPDLEARFLEDREILARHFPDDPSLDLAYPFAP